jgi:hypothetical protein
MVDMKDGLNEKYATGKGVVHVEYSKDSSGHFITKLSYEGQGRVDLKSVIFDSSDSTSNKRDLTWDIISSDKNSIILKSKRPATLDSKYANPKDNFGWSAQHYTNHYHAIMLVRDIQEALSQQEYSIPINIQGEQNMLHVKARIYRNSVDVEIPTRKYDAAPGNIATENVARRNDPSKEPMANALMQALIPIATKHMEHVGGLPPAGSLKYENFVGSFSLLSIDSPRSTTKANQILHDIQARLEILQEQGINISGNFSEKHAKGKQPNVRELKELRQGIEDQVVAAVGNTPETMKLTDDIFKSVQKSMGINPSGPSPQ